MAKRENEAKVKRLRKAAEVIEAELKELFFLPEDQAAPLKATVDFIDKRCDALEANDDASEASETA